MTTYKSNAKPCGACPYRQDCPSGVWAAEEYKKLAEYDKETGNQPLGVFLCHDADRVNTVCKGWVDVHGAEDLLSLRLRMIRGDNVDEVMDTPPTTVPLFESGTEAMRHGLKSLKRPGKKAVKKIAELNRRHPDLKT